VGCAWWGEADRISGDDSPFRERDLVAALFPVLEQLARIRIFKGAVILRHPQYVLTKPIEIHAVELNPTDRPIPILSRQRRIQIAQAGSDPILARIGRHRHLLVLSSSEQKLTIPTPP
jgi:hypothetical protein